MVAIVAAPIILLDFDDVIVLNRPGEYGGYDVMAPSPPPEIWTHIFDDLATRILLDAVTAHEARIVLTTSWLRILERASFERMFELAGLTALSQQLHTACEAPQFHGETRLQAIDRWLAQHHHGEPYIVLDDQLSGTGLRGSVHAKRKRLVLCEVNVGLQPQHVGVIRQALSRMVT